MALTPLLVDAKKEYMHQLADVLTPYVMNTIGRIYDAAQKKEKNFREMLRQVPNWNASNIEERTIEIERRCPQLQDLIAACCVSYTKVLGSIRLNQSQNSNVRVSLPQSSTFVHGVYIYVAKEFFYEPKLVYATRTTKMNLLRDAVDESTRQHVPMQQLLKAYLSVAVDDSGLDPLAAATDGFQTPPVVIQSPVQSPLAAAAAADQQHFEQQLLQQLQQQVAQQEQQQLLQQLPQQQLPQQQLPQQQQPQQQQPQLQQPMMMMPDQQLLHIPQPQAPQAPPMMLSPPPPQEQQQQQQPVDFFGDDFAADFV